MNFDLGYVENKLKHNYKIDFVSCLCKQQIVLKWKQIC